MARKLNTRKINLKNFYETVRETEFLHSFFYQGSNYERDTREVERIWASAYKSLDYYSKTI